MQLTDEQKNTVRQWIGEGQSLSEIQTRIKKDFDVSLLYMDVRLLVAELNVPVQDKPEPEKPKEEAAPEGLPSAGDAIPAPGAGGSVKLTVDEITPPHALIAGKVTFSDGVTADWYFDQMGRLGLNPKQPGYRPSEADVMAFQKELQRIAQQQGLY